MAKFAAFAFQILGLAFLFWAVQPVKAVLPWPAIAVLAVIYLFGVRFISNLLQSAMQRRAP